MWESEAVDEAESEFCAEDAIGSLPVLTGNGVVALVPRRVVTVSGSKPLTGLPAAGKTPSSKTVALKITMGTGGSAALLAAT